MKHSVTGLLFSGLLLTGALAAQACSSSSSGPNATGDDGGVPDTGTIDAPTGNDGNTPVTACAPDETAPVPTDRCTTDANNTTLPQCNTWIKVEIPGTVCGDGSQYKFFVNYSNTSNDLAVEFEPGGACWDYDSCTGNGGTRGAANPHGIADDHMSSYQYLNLLRRGPENPAQNYNMVFVSYCTGDIHTGNNTITYTGGQADGGAADASDDGGDAATPDGGADSIVFHHAGHANTLAVIEWLKTTFATKVTVPKLLVTGCSAGGAGGFINYHFIRSGLGAGVQCSYLLDDSGPIFHSDGPSKQLHEKIRSAWNIDPILDSLEGQLPVTAAALKADFGLMNVALAQKYPKDRLSLVAYHQDLNYSLYSYQRFFPGSTEDQIHTMWWQDMTELMKSYDGQKNMAYYLPFWRDDNCSHCVSIPPIGNPPLEPTDQTKALGKPWLGSEIPQLNIDLKQFTTDLLDDTKPMKSYVQDPQPNEAFTPAISAQCMQ